jgi:hypothetical protein
MANGDVYTGNALRGLMHGYGKCRYASKSGACVNSLVLVILWLCFGYN